MYKYPSSVEKFVTDQVMAGQEYCVFYQNMFKKTVSLFKILFKKTVSFTKILFKKTVSFTKILFKKTVSIT